MDDLRRLLKVWERNFAERTGRRPTAKDIHNAPADVQSAYRQYDRLRKERQPSTAHCPEATLNTMWDSPAPITSSKRRTVSPNSDAASMLPAEAFLQKLKTARSSLKNGEYENQGFPSVSAQARKLMREKVNRSRPLAESTIETLPLTDESLSLPPVTVPLSERPTIKLPPQCSSVTISRRSSFVEKFSRLSSPVLDQLFLQKSPEATKEVKIVNPVREENSVEPNEPKPTSAASASVATIIVDATNEVAASEPVRTNVEVKTSSRPPLKRMAEDSATESTSKRRCVKDTDATTPRRADMPSVSSAPASRYSTISKADNFIKLNLRVKRFSKKGGNNRRFLLKRQYLSKLKWKNRNQNGEGSSPKGPGRKNTPATSTCFRCGQGGHWAKKCPSRFTSASKFAMSEQDAANATSCESEQTVTLRDCRLLHPPRCRESYFCYTSTNPTTTNFTPAEPLVVSDTDLSAALHDLSLTKFRANQLAVIRRILQLQSTVAVMPTGSGKSLCYQLPAVLFHRLQGRTALVISPLISLMQDQIRKLPPGVAGVALNSTMDRKTREQVLQDAKNGKYALLMVSPEALVDYNFLTPERLPPLSFVCIDEAHCLSDWSHHFRPSYLRVCRQLRRAYGVECFLGLTATCTMGTLQNICQHLYIEDMHTGCVLGEALPSNVHLSVSRDLDRDEALLTLLQSEPFCDCASILIYCSTRDQTAHVAARIRTAFQGLPPRQVGRRKLTWTVDAYHAGMELPLRVRVQNRFMQNRLRVLVATSAFGMGLNKADLRAVIHYGSGKSFENYVQEVGRAGRDGEAAWCHTILCSNLRHGARGEQDPRLEWNDLQRHIYANHVDRFTLKKLLDLLFVPCSCTSMESCDGHLRHLPVTSTVERLDLREETLVTLLCYLELAASHTSTGLDILRILPSQHAVCTVHCYGGPRQLAQISHKSDVIAVALGHLHSHPTEEVMDDRELRVNLLQLSEELGWELWRVRRGLSELEWKTNEKGGVSKSGVQVTFDELSLCVAVRGHVSDALYEELLNHLLERVQRLEADAVTNMSRLNRLLKSAAYVNVEQVAFSSEEFVERSSGLRENINAFFNSTDAGEDTTLAEDAEAPITPQEEAAARHSIRCFIHAYRGEFELTGQGIACVLHGIGTPCFPAHSWSKVTLFWRAQLTISWPVLKQWATEELICFV